jgi:ABC-type cobalamin/Fe3+-siderophores transport system ATPase subunit
MSFKILSLIATLPKLGQRTIILARAEDGVATSSATILIGRNGSGKSTILRDIIQLMRPLSRKGRARASAYSVQLLTLVRDGRISSLEGGVVGERSSETIDPDHLPRKLIAMSFTPFDKFPVRDDVNEGLNARDPFYVYLGFKTESGRASVGARVLKTLDRLAFLDTSKQAKESVSSILAEIGYSPKLVLSFSLPMRLRDELVGRSRSDSRSMAEQRQQLVAEGALDILAPKRFSQSIDLTLDFETGQHDLFLSDPVKPSAVSQRRAREGFPLDGRLDRSGLGRLVQAGALRTSSAIVHSLEHGGEVDLLELSSGELSIISGLLGLAAHLSDDALVLIDEPENSLHPAWQLKYVEMLDAIMHHYAGAHYVIATHSPLIVSGAARLSPVIARLDQDPVEVDAEMVADESPDATLIKAFDVVTQHNNFVRQLTLEGLTLIETGEAGSARARDIAAQLSELLPKVAKSDPIRKIMSAYVERVAADVG